jgi:hypothetical protein
MLSNVIAKTVAVTQNPVAREIVLDLWKCILILNKS